MPLDGSAERGGSCQATLKALAADGSEVVPPATPEQFKAKLGREYAELEKPIRTVGIHLK